MSRSGGARQSPTKVGNNPSSGSVGTPPTASPDPDSHTDNEPTSSKRPTWLRDVAIVVASLVVGIGVAALVLRQTSSGPSESVLPAIDLSAGDTADLQIDPGEGADAPVVAPDDATDPEAAVTSFLAAEVAKDFTASFPYLAAEDRTQYPDATRWQAAHRNLPPVAGFRVEGVRPGDGGNQIVSVLLSLDSRLDPVLGLIPARAEFQMVAVPAGDTWTVAYGQSLLRGLYPDDAEAVDAARDWAATTQACEPAEQYDGILFGVADLAEQLCDTEGEVTVGDPTRLPPNGGGTGLTSAFGTEAIAWARVVELTSPTEFSIVLAPVDDRWLVVGIMEAGR